MVVKGSYFSTIGHNLNLRRLRLIPGLGELLRSISSPYVQPTLQCIVGKRNHIWFIIVFFCFLPGKEIIIGILSIKFQVFSVHRSLTDCLLAWWLLSDFPITSHNLNPYFPGTKTGPGLGSPPRSWNHPSSQLAPAPTPLTSSLQPTEQLRETVK